MVRQRKSRANPASSLRKKLTIVAVEGQPLSDDAYQPTTKGTYIVTLSSQFRDGNSALGTEYRGKHCA
jgi:hypothetical protein